jgi:hypothetical protein
MKNLLNWIVCYIDPGNTSYVVQVIIGLVLGIGFYFKSIWWRLKSLFSRKKSADEKKDEDGN